MGPTPEDRVKRHWSVTPTLFVGPSPSPRAIHVSTAEEAVAVIRSGRIAVLPEGAWDEATEALTAISSREWAEHRVTVTRAGRLV